MVKFVIVVIWVMWSIETASGKIPLYEPYFGVDVGDFVARAVLRAEGVVGGRAVTKLIGGTVTALDDDGDAWGWCLFAGVGEDGESADGDGKRVRIDFYFEPSDGGRVRFNDIPQVPDGADANVISILKMINSLDGLVLFPRRVRRSAMIKALRVGNKRGWIGGSYEFDTDDGKVYRPMLFIPNDFDNNGIPDIRQILQARIAGGTELDNNGNWMLDWAENDQTTTGAKNMRTGLHAPGTDGTVATGSHLLIVDGVQIVRFPTQIASLPVGQGGVNVDKDLYGLGDIINGSQNAGTGTPACDNFYNRIREWGTWDGTSTYLTGQQREIIMTVTNKNDAFPDVDQPLAPGDLNYDDRISTIQTFAFRFAHCVDYMQFGNESLKGSSEWGDDGGVPLFCLENSFHTNLLMKGVGWVEDQAEAARIGSALAGRPLRVITPGFPIGVINSGAKGNPTSQYLSNCGITDCSQLNNSQCTDLQNKLALDMREIAKIAARDRMFFDVHMHYTSVTQANDGLGNMVDPSLLAWKDVSTGDVMPAMKVMLEFGPKGDKSQSFWGGFSNEVDEFTKADGSGTPFFDNWDQMVKNTDTQKLGWERTQYLDNGFGVGFQMASILPDILSAEFTAVCYGPSVQGQNATNEVFLIATLRASKVQHKFQWLCDPNDRFTSMLHQVTCGQTSYGSGSDGYEDIITGSPFGVQPFNPHDVNSDGCDQNVACPPQ